MLKSGKENGGKHRLFCGVCPGLSHLESHHLGMRDVFVDSYKRRQKFGVWAKKAGGTGSRFLILSV